MKKRLLAILLSLCLCISMIPLGALTAGAEVDEGGSNQLQMPAPQNVKAQLLGIKFDDNNGKLLLLELSWDAIPQIDGGNSFFEIWPSLKKDENLTYPMDFDAWMGQATVIPATSANPIPGGIEYTTENGRSKLQSLVRILQPNDTQLEDNMAKGIKENDKVDVDIYTAGWDPATQTSGESEHKHVEIVYTEENVKNKKTFTEVASDDKTVAPPEEVVLKYNGQPQDCPFKDTQGYSVSLNDPQTDAGIYTAALILDSGWKWTDGTTAAKPAVWAIDKATITSVTLISSVLLYNGKEQYPDIASVSAGSLTVPAEGYSVSYSATPKLSGYYTLTVKGKGNFTGSASAEFHIDTVGMDTCTHDFPKEYTDNKDDNTHKVFCSKCGGCLANAEKHDLKDEPVNDPETGKPAGKYRTVCSKCGYAIDGTCDHSVAREYVDNGNGTHDERCSRCHVVFATGEAHDLKETPVLSNISGYEIYNGEVSIDCTKCSYHEDQLCSHVGTGRVDYVPAKQTYQGDTMIFTHKSHCERCKMLLSDEEEDCTPGGEWTPRSMTAHETHCSKCGQVLIGACDFKGTRKITKFEATPYKGGEYNFFNFTRYKYRCWYTETCKICHGERKGWFDYPIITVEDWADYRAAFESICKMSPEALQSFHEQDYLQGYKYFLLMPSWFLSPIYEATGTNEMNYANLQSGYLIRLTNTHEAGSCKMFDKNGKEIASYEGHKKSSSPVGANGDEGEDEGISEDELETWRFTQEDGAALGLSTDYLMSLADGEYTYTACFSNENGQTAAVSVVFTIVHDEIGTKVTNVHPLGTMVNADGDVVEMNLSENTLYCTGEALTPPAVTLTSEMGVEYAEGEDYTLTYYQVVEDEDGEAVEIEVAPDNIKKTGTYNVVATPTRNGVLHGEAWATFTVTDYQIGDVDGDGRITISDVTAIQRHIAELNILTGNALLAADTNGDGVINITDATHLQKYLAEFEGIVLGKQAAT